MLTILFLDSGNQKTYCLLAQLGLLLPGLINGTQITVFKLMLNLIKFNDLQNSKKMKVLFAVMGILVEMKGWQGPWMKQPRHCTGGFQVEYSTKRNNAKIIFLFSLGNFTVSNVQKHI